MGRDSSLPPQRSRERLVERPLARWEGATSSLEPASGDGRSASAAGAATSTDCPRVHLRPGGRNRSRRDPGTPWSHRRAKRPVRGERSRRHGQRQPPGKTFEPRTKFHEGPIKESRSKTRRGQTPCRSSSGGLVSNSCSLPYPWSASGRDRPAELHTEDMRSHLSCHRISAHSAESCQDLDREQVAPATHPGKAAPVSTLRPSLRATR